MWSWDFDVYRNGKTSDFDGSFAYTCKLHLAAESLPERVWLGCGTYILQRGVAMPVTSCMYRLLMKKTHNSQHHKLGF